MSRLQPEHPKGKLGSISVRVGFGAAPGRPRPQNQPWKGGGDCPPPQIPLQDLFVLPGIHFLPASALKPLGSAGGGGMGLGGSPLSIKGVYFVLKERKEFTLGRGKKEEGKKGGEKQRKRRGTKKQKGAGGVLKPQPRGFVRALGRRVRIWNTGFI